MEFCRISVRGETFSSLYLIYYWGLWPCEAKLKGGAYLPIVEKVEKMGFALPAFRKHHPVRG
jgi:hypothetical protein